MKLQIIKKNGDSFYTVLRDTKTNEKMWVEYKLKNKSVDFDLFFIKISDLELAQDFSGLDTDYERNEIIKLYTGEIFTSDFEIIRCVGIDKIIEYIQNPYLVKLGTLQYIRKS